VALLWSLRLLVVYKDGEDIVLDGDEFKDEQATSTGHAHHPPAATTGRAIKLHD